MCQISIIIPVYNVEMYLEECINSVLQQTYNNLEIILVDDGSTDNSGKICDEYFKLDSRIKVIHKKNEGLGLSRNVGLKHVSGEYVTFLDSDDYLDSSTIENLFNKIQMYHVDLCKSGFKRIDNNHKIISLRKFSDELFENDETKFKMLPRMIGSAPDKKDSFEMNVCGTLYKTSIIKEHNIRFPSERELISEDMIFNIDYMQFARGSYITSFVGYNYRTNINSLTRSYKKDRFNQAKQFYTVVKDKLIKLGYDYKTIERLQRMFFIYLKVCILEEKNSGFSTKRIINRIKEICSDDLVRQIIREYPVKYLGIQQKVFIKLIYYKLATILYIYSKFLNKNI